MTNRIDPPKVQDVQVQDVFWGQYQKLVRESVIPYQWKALNDQIPGAAKSGCINNFEVAAGRKEGSFYGFCFQDSDLAKWLEAVAYSLAAHPDAELERLADSAIDLVAEAQREDGYLDTYYQLEHPGQEWTCLRENHEMYCAGHMMEAAVAYYEATGKDKLLGVMCRLADHIDRKFGPEEGKLKGYPGHEEIELALIKLARATGQERYAQLAKFFIDQRGAAPNYFEAELERDPSQRYPWAHGPLSGMRYFQAEQPVRDQQEAHGHAVRACYLYSGMADVARETQDAGLMDAARRLFFNIAQRQMYVTGAVGSSEYGEAFTCDYDLPNDTIYGETCASIALAFFARRMLQAEPKGVYADVMERAIYNTALAGMSLSGTNFFYVNPLEIDPATLPYDYNKRHVVPERPAWYGCACCPPNLARLITSIAQYAYLASEDTAYVNLFVGGKARLDVAGGAELTVSTQFPWQGRVEIQVAGANAFTLALRRPGWSDTVTLTQNGKPAQAEEREGYLYLAVQPGDVLVYSLDMAAKRVWANPHVRADAGKVAIQRGPLVYCLEQTDNGRELYNLILPRDSQLVSAHQEQILGGVTVVSAQGIRQSVCQEDALYTYAPNLSESETTLTFVPYYAWNNRGKGEMLVWVRDGR